MQHHETIQTLERVCGDIRKAKDDHWTLDHLSRLHASVGGLCNFLDNKRFPFPAPRPPPRDPQGPHTVDHEGLVAVLEKVNRGLRWDEEWDTQDLREADVTVGEILCLADGLYRRSEYLPPWC